MTVESVLNDTCCRCVVSSDRSHDVRLYCLISVESVLTLVADVCYSVTAHRRCHCTVSYLWNLYWHLLQMSSKQWQLTGDATALFLICRICIDTCCRCLSLSHYFTPIYILIVVTKFTRNFLLIILRLNRIPSKIRPVSFLIKSHSHWAKTTSVLIILMHSISEWMQGIFYRHDNIDYYALRQGSGTGHSMRLSLNKKLWGVRLLMIASNLFCDWIDELIKVFKW